MDTKDMLAVVPNLENLIALAIHGMLAPELAEDGIHSHNPMHWRRTAEIARRIMLQSGHLEIEACVVYSAAILHDIGRQTDGADSGHAAMGAQIAKLVMRRDQWQPMIETPSNETLTLSEEQIDRVSEIIRSHSFHTKGKTLEEQIVKDADKLDRFRLSPEGPDPARLALEVSVKLMPDVKQYVEANL